VVGINTAIAQNSNGIGFAIPIDIASADHGPGRRR
jgi:S1-C subfamily serine protease